MMRKNKTLRLFVLLITTVVVFNQCDTKEKLIQNGNIVFKFDHHINGLPINFDTTIYFNEAGNKYQINLIQYFITNVKLYKSDGSVIQIDDWTNFKYVDTKIPSTLSWEVFDPIPEGNYNKITFTFGWIEAENTSIMFVNDPERNMFWPEEHGGGYHYMKLDYKWLYYGNNLSGGGIHLGRGQIFDSLGNVKGLIDNSFEVSLPASSFTVTENQSKEIQIVMNVENWFKGPNTYDFDTYGGDIMGNQDATILICDNGHDVFKIGYIK